MTRHKRLKMDNPSGYTVAIWIVGIAFSIGGIWGCIAGGMVSGENGDQMALFLMHYLETAATEGVPVHRVSVLWQQVKFPLCISILGFTALGVVGIPIIIGMKGFFLGYGMTCFCRVLGVSGILPSFILLGLPALVWAPALFVLGAQSFLAAVVLLSRTLGARNDIAPYTKLYFIRSGLCGAAVMGAVALECFAIPTILSAAARVVL